MTHTTVSFSSAYAKEFTSYFLNTDITSIPLQRPFNQWPCSNRNLYPTDLHLLESLQQEWNNGQVLHCPSRWSVSHVPLDSSVHGTCKLPICYNTTSHDHLQGSVTMQHPPELSAKLSIGDRSIQACLCFPLSWSPFLQPWQTCLIPQPLRITFFSHIF